jgi:hypothetical protein
MRIEQAFSAFSLVTGLVFSQSAMADKVITVGELAEATSARVLAKALQARSEAGKDPATRQDGPSQNMGGAPQPMILRVSQVGSHEYVTIRMPDGSATQIAVGLATQEGAMVVRRTSVGGYELVDRNGHIASSYNVPTGNSAGGSLPAFGSPASSAIAAPFDRPPVQAMPSSQPVSVGVHP